VWSWLVRPGAGLVGFLRINDTLYRVSEQQFTYDNGLAGRLWDLTKSDGTNYRLTETAEGELACDCQDALYRQHEHTCKHCTSLRAAYLKLADDERLTAFQADIPR
jgi:hypothetical protein